MQTSTKPHVLVLGGNFVGLVSAQKIRVVMMLDEIEALQAQIEVLRGGVE